MTTEAEWVGRKVHHPKDTASLATGSAELTAPWFSGAGLGLFIHFDHASQQGLEASWPLVGGVSTLPGAPTLSVNDYHSSAPTFDPVNWNPTELAELAASAGMTYAVFTARHHSGWSAWPSKVSDRTIASSPYGQRGGDLAGEYVAAFREAGIRVGIYYSLSDWGHEDYPAFTDEMRPYEHKDYPRPSAEQWSNYQQYMRDQLTELLTWYGPIDLLWFDGEWERDEQEWDTAGLERHIRSIAPDIVINDRLLAAGNYRTPEQFIPPRPPAEAWECGMTISGSWSYVPSDTNYKSLNEIVRTLTEVVGTGGNLLLNVGPRPDGSLDPVEAETLRHLADWMSINGESIHSVLPGLEPWQFYGPSARRGDRVYLFDTSNAQEAVIVRGIPVRQVAGVQLLGSPDPLPFTFRTAMEDAFLYDPSGELRIEIGGVPAGSGVRVFALDLDPTRIEGSDTFD
ncbi:hypothetical protein ACI1US_00890 [Leucobacter sp. BZR 635]